MNLPEGYITLAEAAKILKRSKRVVYKLVKDGELPCEKNELNLRVRFKRADVEAVLAKRTAVDDTKDFIGSNTLNLSKLNKPFESGKRDPDDVFHLVQVGRNTVRKVEGPAPPVEPVLSPDEQNAAFLEEESKKPVIWVGDQGFQGVVNGRTAEVRALQYVEDLKKQGRKRFTSVRGI
jgi:excisionase family DNA binding protein